jgi:selT/selW/selH-like putative selenoprotein
MQQFPGLKVEGGPYTPPVAVQYTVRAVRAAQVGVGLFFLFGEQIFAKLGKPAPPVYYQMHDNKLIAAGGIYALDVMAQTAKSINAFEITYNGNVLHSKIKSGKFPAPAELTQSLRQIMAKEKPPSSDGDAAAAA